MFKYKVGDKVLLELTVIEVEPPGYRGCLPYNVEHDSGEITDWVTEEFMDKYAVKPSKEEYIKSFIDSISVKEFYVNLYGSEEALDEASDELGVDLVEFIEGKLLEVYSSKFTLEQAEGIAGLVNNESYKLLQEYRAEAGELLSNELKNLINEKEKN